MTFINGALPIFIFALQGINGSSLVGVKKTISKKSPGKRLYKQVSAQIKKGVFIFASVGSEVIYRTGTLSPTLNPTLLIALKVIESLPTTNNIT